MKKVILLIVAIVALVMVGCKNVNPPVEPITVGTCTYPLCPEWCDTSDCTCYLITNCIKMPVYENGSVVDTIYTVYFQQNDSIVSSFGMCIGTFIDSVDRAEAVELFNELCESDSICLPN